MLEVVPFGGFAKRTQLLQGSIRGPEQCPLCLGRGEGKLRSGRPLRLTAPSRSAHAPAKFRGDVTHVLCHEIQRPEIHDRQICGVRPFNLQHRGSHPNPPTETTTARSRSGPDRSDAARTG